jgi:hypothetical protein
MICDNCKTGGAMNSIGEISASHRMHDRCDYPASCTCQHGVGGEWVNHGNARS